MLERVTITGADDGVNPNDLVSLRDEFPFVEWGILRSSKRTGTPRYPTEAWVRRLPAMRMALHLCGSDAREILSGSGAGLASADKRPASLEAPR